MNKFLLLFALLLSAAMPTFARAAECTEIPSAINYIAASPGNYCLGGNISANAPSGFFIKIDADDVQLDCRGYTLHNTQAAPNSGANAIQLTNHRNVRIRNCRISGGFAAGIYVYQDNGLANQNRNIEISGNTISGSLWFGIHAYGTDIFIRDNTILDIGGRASFAMGIRVGGSIVQGQSRYFVVEDNVVKNIASPVNTGYGIYANNADHGVFRNNMVSETLGAQTYFGYGIRLIGSSGNKLTGNHVVGLGNGYDAGIDATSADTCFDNYVRDTGPYSYLDCNQTLGNY